MRVFFFFPPAQREKSCVTRLYFLLQNYKINSDETASPHSTFLSLFLLLFFTSLSIQKHHLRVSKSPSGVVELKGCYARNRNTETLSSSLISESESVSKSRLEKSLNRSWNSDIPSLGIRQNIWNQNRNIKTLGSRIGIVLESESSSRTRIRIGIVFQPCTVSESDPSSQSLDCPRTESESKKLEPGSVVPFVNCWVSKLSWFPLVRIFFSKIHHSLSIGEL